MSVLEQIERALNDWLQRTIVPPAPSAVPASFPSAQEPTLLRIEEALENAGQQSRETNVALEEAAARLSQWHERATALRRLAESTPPSVS